MIWLCFQLFYNKLEDNNIEMELYWIWSDGYARQLKNSHVFQWLCIFHKRNRVPHIWNYFETRHGKGEHDAEGASINIALHKKEMKFKNYLSFEMQNTLLNGAL